MRVAIAGGALQGLELTYLARKAGLETLLLDRRDDTPASGICDRSIVADLTDDQALDQALDSVDLVVPATEDEEALRSLTAWCIRNRMPLALDPHAYAITSSKRRSNGLFRELDIPSPAPWPDCAYPVLSKPDGGSGSRDVEVFSDLAALEARFGALPPKGYVLQEYVSGPTYSIEVMGCRGGYAPLQVTDLEMDSEYDCKRVLAPSSLPDDLIEQFEGIAVTLAQAVDLMGIMDVEVICHDGRLLVLEIDARFPSQTPIAVFRSTGVNMLERLARIFAAEGGGDLDLSTGSGAASIASQGYRGVILEHVRVRAGELAVCGEHVMAENGPLHLEADFFGADEALTNYAAGRHDWVATLMVGGSDLEDAWDRRDRVIRGIRDRLDLKTYRDEYPPGRVSGVS
jgi:pyrrolysine biosynthesis protein PylC